MPKKGKGKSQAKAKKALAAEKKYDAQQAGAADAVQAKRRPPPLPKMSPEKKAKYIKDGKVAAGELASLNQPWSGVKRWDKDFDWGEQTDAPNASWWWLKVINELNGLAAQDPRGYIDIIEHETEDALTGHPYPPNRKPKAKNVYAYIPPGESIIYKSGSSTTEVQGVQQPSSTLYPPLLKVHQIVNSQVMPHSSSPYQGKGGIHMNRLSILRIPQVDDYVSWEKRQFIAKVIKPQQKDKFSEDEWIHDVKPSETERHYRKYDAIMPHIYFAQLRANQVPDGEKKKEMEAKYEINDRLKSDNPYKTVQLYIQPLFDLNNNKLLAERPQAEWVSLDELEPLSESARAKIESQHKSWLAEEAKRKAELARIKAKEEAELAERVAAEEAAKAEAERVAAEKVAQAEAERVAAAAAEKAEAERVAAEEAAKAAEDARLSNMETKWGEAEKERAAQQREYKKKVETFGQFIDYDSSIFRRSKADEKKQEEAEKKRFMEQAEKKKKLVDLQNDYRSLQNNINLAKKKNKQLAEQINDLSKNEVEERAKIEQELRKQTEDKEKAEEKFKELNKEIEELRLNAEVEEAALAEKKAKEAKAEEERDKKKQEEKKAKALEEKRIVDSKEEEKSDGYYIIQNVDVLDRKYDNLKNNVYCQNIFVDIFAKAYQYIDSQMRKYPYESWPGAARPPAPGPARDIPGISFINSIIRQTRAKPPSENITIINNYNILLDCFECIKRILKEKIASKEDNTNTFNNKGKFFELWESIKGEINYKTFENYLKIKEVENYTNDCILNLETQPIPPSYIKGAPTPVISGGSSYKRTPKKQRKRN